MSKHTELSGTEIEHRIWIINQLDNEILKRIVIENNENALNDYTDEEINNSFEEFRQNEIKKLKEMKYCYSR